LTLPALKATNHGRHGLKIYFFKPCLPCLRWLTLSDDPIPAAFAR